MESRNPKVWELGPLYQHWQGESENFSGLQHKYKTLQEKPKKKFKVEVYCHINGTWRYDNDELQFLGF